MNQQKQIFGLPVPLIWGYIAIAMFMAGDGFEAAFLSKYLTDIGFSQTQSSLTFTAYGLLVALAAWSSGVVAEIITPQKAMCFGFLNWSVMHILFMVFGIGFHNYPLMLLFYGIRGLGYPLFLYSFVILIIQNVPKSKVSTAMGWFWASYSIGFGVLGGFLPGFVNPIIGEYHTLWMSLAWVTAGGIIALVVLRHAKVDRSKTTLPFKEKTKELFRAVTILFSNKHIFMSALVRIANTTPIFGFAVIMPWLLIGKTANDHGLGFSKSEWQYMWTVFMFVTIFTNIMWGILGDYIGWLRQARWFGCIGGALACSLFYYIPVIFGHNLMLAMIPAVVFGITVAAFVPMTAVFATLEPNHKGAAISIYNLSAGLSNFVGPGIAALMVPFFGIIGAVWSYIVLYLFAATLTLFIKVEQPKSGSAEISEVEPIVINPEANPS